MGIQWFFCSSSSTVPQRLQVDWIKEAYIWHDNLFLHHTSFVTSLFKSNSKETFKKHQLIISVKSMYFIFLMVCTLGSSSFFVKFNPIWANYIFLNKKCANADQNGWDWIEMVRLWTKRGKINHTVCLGWRVLLQSLKGWFFCLV